MPTLRTATLGCKVNQYETEYVRQGLARLGWTEADDDRPADLCLVNTCTVTADGDMKSRKIIRQFARQNPGAEIVVMGCYASRAPEELAALPGVVEVVTDKRRLPELLARFGLVDAPEGLDSFGSRHRAHVKIQDGCAMRCAYCIIPACRTELVSRPAESVFAEIDRLVGGGHREIVLTGIHLGLYGAETNGDDQCAGGPAIGGASGCSTSGATTSEANSPAHASGLVDLLRRVVDWPGRFRVRLSSLESREITPELIELMAGSRGRICPHLHVSVQSGSNRVLRCMRRRDTAEEIIDRCRAVQKALDAPGLTADVIVGFPGESEADFEASCSLVRDVGFSKVHVFRFSPREGTAAAAMSDQIDGRVKHERASRLIALADELRQRYLQSLCGRRLEVLVERTVEGEPTRLRGTSARYAPVELPAETTGGTEFSGDDPLLGKLVEAEAVAVCHGRLQC